MEWRFDLGVTVIALVLAGCGEQIPLVGIDGSGQEFEQQVSANAYSEDLGTFLSSLNESVVPALSELDTGSTWSVRAVVVGAVISGSVGVGDLQVGASERFRVAFSNSANPALP